MQEQSHATAAMDTQRYVALDLEYNQPSGTIIQVGVAIGNASQSQHEYVVRRWDLKVDEPISEFITQLAWRNAQKNLATCYVSMRCS